MYIDTLQLSQHLIYTIGISIKHLTRTGRCSNQCGSGLPTYRSDILRGVYLTTYGDFIFKEEQILWA